jgi:APA family basic amino acid/polyamine antiporter
MGIWTKKTLTALQQEPDQGPIKLNRSLGSLNLMLLGIGSIIGAGLFSITGIAAAENAGPAITISFVISAIGCAFVALCYSELATMIPISGSAYTYAYATMGQLIAWIIGWDLVLEYAIGATAVSISWSAYVVSVLHDLNINLPDYLLASPWQPVHYPDGTDVYGIFNLPAAFVVVVLSLLLLLGIKQAAFVNGLIVFIKVLVILAFISIGFFYINPSNYVPFIPENHGVFGEFGWSGIMRGAGVVFFAYIGFDAVSTASQEAKHPQKGIPIGIIGSLLVCTILYISFAFIMTGLVNYQELNVAAPVAKAIAQTPYVWLNGIIKIAIVAGLTSVILVFLLGQSRIFFSMSRDRLLPPIFSTLHPKFRTPWRSHLILMLFVGILAGLAPLSEVGHMTSIGTLLAFVIVCIGVLILRYTDPEHVRPFKTPWVPFVPLMGIFICLAMMISLGVTNWIRLIVWLAIGLLFYFFYGRKKALI